VAAICAMQSAQTALGIAWLYQCLILNLEELDKISIVILMHTILSLLSGAIVHSSYAWRIWCNDRVRRALALLTGLIGLSSSVFGIAAMSYGYNLSRWSALRNSETISILVSLSIALDIAVDIMQPVLMVDSLRGTRKERNGVTFSVAGAVQTWTIYLSGTGMFNCIFAVLSLVLFWWRRTDLLFLGFVEIRSRLYANCLLSSLNTRHHEKTEAFEMQWTSWDFGPKSSIMTLPHNAGVHTMSETAVPAPVIQEC